MQYLLLSLERVQNIICHKAGNSYSGRCSCNVVVLRQWAAYVICNTHNAHITSIKLYKLRVRHGLTLNVASSVKTTLALAEVSPHIR